MAKLYFSYAAMKAGKSDSLLQVASNYGLQSMPVYLMTADKDDRSGSGKIRSRDGVSHEAYTFTPDTDIFQQIALAVEVNNYKCILIDNAHWMSKRQVWQLSKVVDMLRIPVMCYGLRTDFKGDLFEGASELLALADDLREIRAICHCGRKATMVIRRATDGAVMTNGPQEIIEDDGAYESMCRRHWRELVGK